MDIHNALDTHIENFASAEMTDYLDANSGSILGLKKATEDLGSEIGDRMEKYSRDRLGYRASSLDREIGVYSELSLEIAEIGDELREEASDMSFLEKLWFRTGRDLWSQKREQGITDRVNPLGNESLKNIERLIDQEYYLQKLKNFKQVYQTPGRDGGLDRINSDDFLSLLHEIDIKNEKYVHEGELLSDEEIRDALTLLDERDNPLLVLYRYKDAIPEDQVKALLKNDVKRYGLGSVEVYLDQLLPYVQENGQFSIAPLIQYKTIDSQIALPTEKIADFVRFLYQNPALNEAFVRVLSDRPKMPYEMLRDGALAYRHQDEYDLAGAEKENPQREQ